MKISQIIIKPLQVRSQREETFSHSNFASLPSSEPPVLSQVPKVQNLLQGSDTMQLRREFYNVLRNTEEMEYPELSFFKSLTPAELDNLSIEELNKVITYLHLELGAMPKKENITEIVKSWIDSENQVALQSFFPERLSEENGQISPRKNGKHLLSKLNLILQQLAAQSSIKSKRDDLAKSVKEMKIKIEQTRKNNEGSRTNEFS